MINANDFRLKDLDELVPLFGPDYKEGTPLDIKKIKDAYFPIGKNSYMYYGPVEKSNEVYIKLKNNVICEVQNFGGTTGKNIADVDFNSLLENFIVFDYVSNQKSFIGKKNVDPMQIYELVNNLKQGLDCSPNLKPVEQIVSPEIYKKALDKAKKAFNKSQEQTIDSQTPEPL